MSKKVSIIASLLMLSAILISYQVGLYVQNKKQVQELGEVNVKLLPLLTRPSDFNSNEILWEKVDYQLAIINFDKREIGKAVSIMPGEQAGNNAGFVLIHEIIVYAEGNVPTDNLSDYYNPFPLSKPFPDIGINDQSYCWSSDLDYLSECSITIKNTKIISTFTIRIFEPNEQIAFEILPLAAKKFMDRLEKSDLGK